jgi:clathrin heavy chain
MARKTVREPQVDGYMLLSYAKTDRLHDLEDFLASLNVADVLDIGEKCYNEELYHAAKILFTSISNWARLASTLVHLGEYQNAVDCARKANSTKSYLTIIKLTVGFGNKSTKHVSRRENSVLLKSVVST